MTRAETAAYELVRQYGFVEAQARSMMWRDASSLGTMSWILHHQVCRALYEFATVGPVNRRRG